MSDITKPKGYIPGAYRDTCDDCFFMKWVGSGSRNQQMTYCTKVTPNLIVSLDDICDEFKPLDNTLKQHGKD
jgi:hypothetical protein